MIAEVKFEDESRCCSTLAVSSWSLKDELGMSESEIYINLPNKDGIQGGHRPIHIAKQRYIERKALCIPQHLPRDLTRIDHLKKHRQCKLLQWTTVIHNVLQERNDV